MSQGNGLKTRQSTKLQLIKEAYGTFFWSRKLLPLASSLRLFECESQNENN